MIKTLYSSILLSTCFLTVHAQDNSITGNPIYFSLYNSLLENMPQDQEVCSINKYVSKIEKGKLKNKAPKFLSDQSRGVAIQGEASAIIAWIETYNPGGGERKGVYACVCLGKDKWDCPAVYDEALNKGTMYTGSEIYQPVDYVSASISSTSASVVWTEKLYEDMPLEEDADKSTNVKRIAWAHYHDHNKWIHPMAGDPIDSTGFLYVLESDSPIKINPIITNTEIKDNPAEHVLMIAWGYVSEKYGTDNGFIEHHVCHEEVCQKKAEYGLPKELSSRRVDTFLSSDGNTYSLDIVSNNNDATKSLQFIKYKQP
ncbi:MAG: hypothetical protein KDD48_07175 [Bdellovibrionales bacterium]|nr:hypothetical protein [Bdellovibrionales bacterium]